MVYSKCIFGRLQKMHIWKKLNLWFSVNAYLEWFTVNAYLEGKLLVFSMLHKAPGTRCSSNRLYPVPAKYHDKVVAAIKFILYNLAYVSSLF